MTAALVLVAHGSQDPRAEDTVNALAYVVAAQLTDVPVRAAYLDHSSPTPLEVLLALAAEGLTHARVVPLLFAPGFHVRTDLPAAVDEARVAAPLLSVRVTSTLVDLPADLDGADLLLDVLDERVAVLAGRPKALVLSAAGSSDPGARAQVHELAARWADRRGLPAAAAFASGPGDRADVAVKNLAQSQGIAADAVVVGSLFLADGFLPGRTARAATAAGASAAAVLGAAPQLAELVVRRYRSHQAAVPLAS